MKDVEEMKDIVNEGKKPTGKKAEKLQRLQALLKKDLDHEMSVKESVSDVGTYSKWSYKDLVERHDNLVNEVRPAYDKMKRLKSSFTGSVVDGDKSPYEQNGFRVKLIGGIDDTGYDRITQLAGADQPSLNQTNPQNNINNPKLSV